MVTITVNVDDEVYQKFRENAAQARNGKKGFLGDAITEAMRNHVEENEQEVIKKRLLERLRKGVNVGFKGYKCRSELYDERVERILSAGR
ncbi:hypothetical protein HYU16_01335 [Candidatus Woesearchaeota archaeon]|nr:hypothetical protein [Candidatus Woesearchaeota archaeon]